MAPLIAGAKCACERRCRLGPSFAGFKISLATRVLLMYYARHAEEMQEQKMQIEIYLQSGNAAVLLGCLQEPREPAAYPAAGEGEGMTDPFWCPTCGPQEDGLGNGHGCCPCCGRELVHMIPPQPEELTGIEKTFGIVRTGGINDFLRIT